MLNKRKYFSYLIACYIFIIIFAAWFSYGHYATMYYIYFLDERFNEMRKLMNKNFRVKLDGVLCGFSRLCVILGESRAYELVRRALRSTVQVFSPKALCAGHVVKFYAK